MIFHTCDFVFIFAFQFWVEFGSICTCWLWFCVFQWKIWSWIWYPCATRMSKESHLPAWFFNVSKLKNIHRIPIALQNPGSPLTKRNWAWSAVELSYLTMTTWVVNCQLTFRTSYVLHFCGKLLVNSRVLFLASRYLGRILTCGFNQLLSVGKGHNHLT